MTNYFQPISTSAKHLMGAITICCRDCDTRVRWAKAVEDNWQTCDTNMGDTVRLDYMCPDCVECWHEELSSSLNDQANDI